MHERMHYNIFYQKVKLFPQNSHFRQLFGQLCKFDYVNFHSKYASIFPSSTQHLVQIQKFVYITVEKGTFIRLRFIWCYGDRGREKIGLFPPRGLTFSCVCATFTPYNGCDEDTPVRKDSQREAHYGESVLYPCRMGYHF